MITAVMLNWARPHYTLANLKRYASYGIVKQVICFNNGQPLDKTNLSKKCVLIESSNDVGLYSRFAAASLAATEAVFHTDDDIAVPESTLHMLYRYWLGARYSCHGLHGRAVRPTYNQSNVFGPVEVVLTRAVICSQQINNAALSAAHLFGDLESVPRGNGEDIILSFAAMSISRSLNCAYQFASDDYADCDEHAIHRRWPNHIVHRQRVVSRCREIYSL